MDPNRKLSILHKIVHSTRSNKMEWFIEGETINNIIYVCIIKLTDLKSLIFRFSYNYHHDNYYLSIKLIIFKIYHKNKSLYKSIPITRLDSYDPLYGSDMELIYNSIKYIKPIIKPKHLSTNF